MKIIIDNEEKARVLRDARSFVDAAFRDAADVEAEVRAFSADRLRQRGPYRINNVIPFPAGGRDRVLRLHK